MALVKIRYSKPIWLLTFTHRLHSFLSVGKLLPHLYTIIKLIARKKRAYKDSHLPMPHKTVKSRNRSSSRLAKQRASATQRRRMARADTLRKRRFQQQLAKIQNHAPAPSITKNHQHTYCLYLLSLSVRGILTRKFGIVHAHGRAFSKRLEEHRRNPDFKRVRVISVWSFDDVLESYQIPIPTSQIVYNRLICGFETRVKRRAVANGLIACRSKYDGGYYSELVIQSGASRLDKIIKDQLQPKSLQQLYHEATAGILTGVVLTN